MFKVLMKTDNAAFEDLPNEIAWIMRRIADRVEVGEIAGACLDSNGNKVGHWELVLD